MERRVLPATALALTLLLTGCGTDPAAEGAGSSASTLSVLTEQERATARTALASYVGGQDSARFTATATKATLGAYLGAYASDVVMGTDAPIGRDEVVLVAAVTGPVDTSSMQRPRGATVPAASGAIVVLDSSGALVSRTILLDGQRPDLARLGGPVEALDVASE